MDALIGAITAVLVALIGLLGVRDLTKRFNDHVDEVHS